MRRLIDADRLIEELNELADAEHGQWTRFNDEAAFGAMNAFYKAISIVKHMKPVDSGIVHCGDCSFVSYDKMFGDYWCNGHKLSKDDFCSKGKIITNTTTIYPDGVGDS